MLSFFYFIVKYFLDLLGDLNDDLGCSPMTENSTDSITPISPKYNNLSPIIASSTQREYFNNKNMLISSSPNHPPKKLKLTEDDDSKSSHESKMSNNSSRSKDTNSKKFDEICSNEKRVSEALEIKQIEPQQIKPKQMEVKKENINVEDFGTIICMNFKINGLKSICAVIDFNKKTIEDESCFLVNPLTHYAFKFEDQQVIL